MTALGSAPGGTIAVHSVIVSRSMGIQSRGLALLLSLLACIARGAQAYPAAFAGCDPSLVAYSAHHPSPPSADRQAVLFFTVSSAASLFYILRSQFARSLVSRLLQYSPVAHPIYLINYIYI